LDLCDAAAERALVDMTEFTGETGRDDLFSVLEISGIVMDGFLLRNMLLVS
jgi:hypothetical protein